MTMPLLQRILTAALASATLLLGACVYRLDVQQGNLLDDEDVAAVQPGMTRSQVRFLLGTPMIADSFRQDRWDYVYYLRKGRERTAQKRWISVAFDGDKVREVQRDLPFGQES